MVQPIWQALAGLEIEGEYCQSAVDAVERVTTQMFQIVITDWDDQPEAGFLLKTARDLKAAHRPLTLAIVSDDGKRPAALQAGANSILLKPLRTEQVRDTMSTACQLLRARMQPQAAPQNASAAIPQQKPPKAPAASSTAVTKPASVTRMPEAFRPGEFLQSPGPAPGAQFDTESEIQKSLDHVVPSEVDALTDLEPTAAAVDAAAAPEPAPEPEPEQPLTGWASLQARLTRQSPPKAREVPENDVPGNDISGNNVRGNDVPGKMELLSYGAPSYAMSPAKSADRISDQTSGKTADLPKQTPAHEAALFAYIDGERPEKVSTEKIDPVFQSPPTRRQAALAASALAAMFLVLLVVPKTRQGLKLFSRNAVRAGRVWLNPAPAPLPQNAPQHDSFGQSGDEYKLPVAGNIPDATTDPSQIRVLPVIDPTAKPEKGATTTGQPSASAEEDAPDPNPAGQTQNQNQSNAPQPETSELNAPKSPTAQDPSANVAGTSVPNLQPLPAEPNMPSPQAAGPQLRPAVAQNPVKQTLVSAANPAGIPSSLRSQIAPATSEAGGTKPDEAAMSSIEPVILPETAARILLAQADEPTYPAAAKASGQQGSVTLQVLVGRDGTVHDAKFLQGSLVFARAAIDAVKQWKFKPYLMNGRAVSVQSTLTLNFKPPA